MHTQAHELLNQQLLTIWSAVWPTLLIFIVLILAAVAALVWKIYVDVRAEFTGADDGAGLKPRPQLTAVQCCACSRLKCADGYWRPDYMVSMPPVLADTSHMLCPVCERAKPADDVLIHDEGTSFAHAGSQLSTPKLSTP